MPSNIYKYVHFLRTIEFGTFQDKNYIKITLNKDKTNKNSLNNLFKEFNYLISETSISQVKLDNAEIQRRGQEGNNKKQDPNLIKLYANLISLYNIYLDVKDKIPGDKCKNTNHFIKECKQKSIKEWSSSQYVFTSRN